MIAGSLLWQLYLQIMQAGCRAEQQGQQAKERCEAVQSLFHLCTVGRFDPRGWCSRLRVFVRGVSIGRESLWELWNDLAWAP
jgi:hypothetical protein